MFQVLDFDRQELPKVNLLDFTNGNIAKEYSDPMEKGLPLQGNIGTILNNSNEKLKGVVDGVLLNRLNKTNNNGNSINLSDNDSKLNNITTPLKYCNEGSNSELLPKYPFSNEDNKMLNANCNLMIDNKPAPLLYGENTFGLNDINVANSKVNYIGHQLQQNGVSNKYGIRALSQANYACQNLMPGSGVPLLKNQNFDGTFSPMPTNFTDQLPLYAVGDWQTETPNNFYKNFKDSLNESGCVKPKPDPEPLPPIIPIMPDPVCPPCPGPKPIPGPGPKPIPGPRPGHKQEHNNINKSTNNYKAVAFEENTFVKQIGNVRPRRPME